jgi:hypothetical protein
MQGPCPIGVQSSLNEILGQELLWARDTHGEEGRAMNRTLALPSTMGPPASRNYLVGTRTAKGK